MPRQAGSRSPCQTFSCQMPHLRHRSRQRPAPRLSSPPTSEHDDVNLKPTPLTAALAGAIAGMVMPLLWLRLAHDSMGLVIAFLVVVALPAHAFVVGFGRNQTPDARTIDTALLKRVGAWLLSAVVATAIAQALHA